MDERGKSPMVDEYVPPLTLRVLSSDNPRFWKSVGKPILRGRKEPGGRLNERIDAPPKLLSECSYSVLLLS